MSEIILKDSELDSVCKFVMEICGNKLDRSKGYLIESRLKEICGQTDVKSYSKLCEIAESKKQLQNVIIDAITTNETSFFRDQASFDALQHKAIPELLDARFTTSARPQLKIWSAGCSTGQEAYSIAMLLFEMIPNIHEWDLQILGSDISEAAVCKAISGEYTHFEMERGLPLEFREKYFHQVNDGYKISEQIRSVCHFEIRNLIEPFFGFGPFDVVFCRNAAIYFSGEDRTNLFKRITSCMARDASLFVGSSESLADIGPKFQPQHHCRSVFYQPNR